METFKDFLNEKLTDLMTPKSDDDIRKKMDSLKPSEKMDYIRRSKLLDEYKPSDDEIKDELKTLPALDQISYIKNYHLSKELFPSIDDIQIGVIEKVMELYPKTTNKDLTNMVEVLFNNGYIFCGVNIEDIGQYHKIDREKDVTWFKFEEPLHYISLTDDTKLKELKDRINLYKKRYSL